MSAWNIPPELAAPAPRQVRMRSGYKTMMIAVAATLLLPVLFLAAVGANEMHKIQTLRDRGVATEAAITKLYVAREKSGRVPHVEYEFHTGDNSAREPGHRILSEAEYAGLHVGGPLPVVYDPEDPALSRVNVSDMIHKEFWRTAFRPLVVTTGLLLALLAALMGLGIWFCARQKRLLRFGSVAAGAIVGEQEYRAKYGIESKVSYSFTDAHGATIEGAQKRIPGPRDLRKNRIAFRALVLTNPTVLYDPADSTINMLYPAPFVEVSARG